jgi:hypothetical protein
MENYAWAVLDDTMKGSIRVAACLAVLLPARTALADDSHVNIVVAVDVTEAGKEILRPTPAHPAFYLPYTRGYASSDGTLTGLKRPPPNAVVEHMITDALAGQGYRLMTKKTPPSLILIFWWGYIVTMKARDPMTAGMNVKYIGGYAGGGTAGIMQLVQSDQILTNAGITNSDDMETMVFGSSNVTANLNHNNPRMEALLLETRASRYFVMISALAFNAAAKKKKIVLLWTARMSTPLWAHDFGQVVPALIATGAPMFGRQTRIPHLVAASVVPLGRVVVGTPVLSARQPATAPSSSAAP